MNTKILTLPVKQEYFDQIEAGEKNEEFRQITKHWQARLENKKYEYVIITLGYPKKEDRSRRIVFTWTGVKKKIITHKEFGSKPVEVYAIPLKHKQLQLF